jgi:hypothetical protein
MADKPIAKPDKPAAKHFNYTENKHKNLDDFFDHLHDTHYRELTDVFKDLDNFKKEENLNHYYNAIFTPGQDELYKKTTSELDAIFKKDEAKLTDKKDDIQKAIVKGLLAYFEKVHPGLLKEVFDKNAPIEDQYQILTQLMDEHLGAREDEYIYRGIAENYAKDKKATVGHLKRHLKSSQGKHLESAIQYLVNQKTSSNLAGRHRIQVAGYLKKEAEKSGYTIDDKVLYASHDMNDLLQIREGIKTGKWLYRGQASAPEHYGLTKKEDKAETKEGKKPKP